MSLDPYSLCPCGSGKKLKFCCSDLTHEMEKIQKMLDGEQHVACLDHIHSLETKYPERASLWGLQAMLEMQSGKTDEARTTLDKFLAKYPDNPVALAERAMLLAVTEGGRAAVGPLQDALSAINKSLPGRVFEAIGAVGHALLAQGELFAARAHFLLCANIGGVDDTRAMQFLMRFNSDPHVPLMFKEPPSMAAAPQGVAWQSACNEALTKATRGCWRDAVNRIEEAIQSAGEVPELWRNLALLRGWLADTAGAVEALRKWVSFDIPLDHAVEVEALAQLLQRGLDTDEDQVETICLSFPIVDVEKADTVLAADARSERSVEDPATLVAESDVPPKTSFHLLDRPLPATGVDIARADIPQVSGRLFLFGKETDRDARLDLVTARDEKFDATVKILRDVLGDVLGGAADDEVVVGQTARVNHAMGWSWRLPNDTPPEHQQQLLNEQRRVVIFEVWPDLPLSTLGGKSVKETARDPDGQIAALAAILLTEQSDTVEISRLDLNALREQLGLPTADLLDPTGWKAEQVSLARVPRLLVERLSDEALLQLYRRAAMTGARSAVRILASEVVVRESLKDKVDRAEAYGLLARCAIDPNEELRLVQHARDAAIEVGDSPAEWLLTLLTLHIERGDGPEVQQLVGEIQTNHFEEKGVPEALLQILYAAGIVDPRGAPLSPQQPQGQQSGVAIPDQEPSSGKIWTPDDDSAAPGKKSAIWTP